jgi:hypothetical protein
MGPGFAKHLGSELLKLGWWLLVAGAVFGMIVGVCATASLAGPL